MKIYNIRTYALESITTDEDPICKHTNNTNELLTTLNKNKINVISIETIIVPPILKTSKMSDVLDAVWKDFCVPSFLTTIVTDEN